MPHLGKVVFPLFIFLLLIIFSNQAIAQTQDSTKAQSPQITQTSQQDSVSQVTKQDSLQQKSWLERNPALVGLIGAFIGAAVALIGVLINRQTGKKTSKLTEAEKQTQIRVEKEEKAKIEIQARATFI